MKNFSAILFFVWFLCISQSCSTTKSLPTRGPHSKDTVMLGSYRYFAFPVGDTFKYLGATDVVANLKKYSSYCGNQVVATGYLLPKAVTQILSDRNSDLGVKISNAYDMNGQEIFVLTLIRSNGKITKEDTEVLGVKFPIVCSAISTMDNIDPNIFPLAEKFVQIQSDSTKKLIDAFYKNNPDGQTKYLHIYYSIDVPHNINYNGYIYVSNGWDGRTFLTMIACTTGGNIISKAPCYVYYKTDCPDNCDIY